MSTKHSKANNTLRFLEVAPDNIPHRSLLNMAHLTNISLEALEENEEGFLFQVSISCAGHTFAHSFLSATGAVSFYNDLLRDITKAGASMTLCEPLEVPKAAPPPPPPSTNPVDAIKQAVDAALPDDGVELGFAALPDDELIIAPTHDKTLAWLKSFPESYLRVLAARAKVPEGELRDIVLGEPMSESIADALQVIMLTDTGLGLVLHAASLNESQDQDSTETPNDAT